MKRMSRRAALIVGLALCPPLVAQELLWTLLGPGGSRVGGHGPVALGDIDGDGWFDLLTDGDTLTRSRGHAELWFLSGKDGAILRAQPSRSLNHSFTRFTSTGDMDGDGVADYAVVSRDADRKVRTLEVRSALDDRTLWSTERPYSGYLGYALAGDLDLDGDRKPDVIVSDTRVSPGGAIYAYSNNGTLLYTVLGTQELLLGVSLAKVGDVNGDGKDEFVSGAYDVDNLGRALLISGADGRILQTGRGELPGDYTGYSVTGCGDLDGDGAPDFASGGDTFFSARGAVRVFSGRTGNVLYTLTGPSPLSDGFGTSLAGGHDFDQDGVPDLVIGAPGVIQYSGVFVISGRDRAVLYQEAGSYNVGDFVSASRAAPGSPFPLFFLPQWWYYANPGWSRTRCFRGAPKGVQVFGAPFRGTLPAFPKIGLRNLGSNGVRIHLSGAEPGRPAALLLGWSRSTYLGQPLPMPLYPLGFPDGSMLYTSIDAMVGVTTGTTGIASGYAYVDLPLRPTDPGSLTIHAQWLCFDAAHRPAAFSQAISWRVH